MNAVHTGGKTANGLVQRQRLDSEREHNGGR